jgi:hypothetical protein
LHPLHFRPIGSTFFFFLFFFWNYKCARSATAPSIIFNPKLCSLFNSNRFARRTVFPSLISSSFAKVLTAENHFQNLARIALFAFAKQSKKKKACTGSCSPCGKVAGFTKPCAVLLFPSFAKRNFQTSSTRGRNMLSISRINSAKMFKHCSSFNKKKRNTPILPNPSNNSKSQSVIK